MDAIKAEIARKRKQLEEAKLVTESKKYFKRGELLSKQEEEYVKNNPNPIQTPTTSFKSIYSSAVGSSKDSQV